MIEIRFTAGADKAPRSRAEFLAAAGFFGVNGKHVVIAGPTECNHRKLPNNKTIRRTVVRQAREKNIF